MDLSNSGVSLLNLLRFVASDDYGDINHSDCAIGLHQFDKLHIIQLADLIELRAQWMRDDRFCSP